MRLWLQAGEVLLGSRLGDVPAVTVVVPEGMSDEDADRWVETRLKCRFHARRIPDIQVVRHRDMPNAELLRPWR